MDICYSLSVLDYFMMIHIRYFSVIIILSPNIYSVGAEACEKKGQI